MKRFMSLAAFFCLTVSSGLIAAPGRIALIYSASSKQLNTPTLAFYQSIAGQFATSNNWQLISYAEVDRYLPKKTGRLTPSSIPAISRAEFLNAHPQASNPAKTKKPANKGVSKSLQELLDTLAAEGAVVVDCVPQGGDRVKACGIYFYDRAAGRVVASMRKDFKVGITDATRWSGVMVSGLHSGLVAVRDNKSKAQLESILDKSTDDSSNRKIGVHFDARGESTIRKYDAADMAPAFSLGVSTMSNGTGAGIEASVSEQRNQSSSGRELKWFGRRAGLFMTSEIEAQETMVWSLDVGLGVSDRKFILNEDGTEAGSLQQKEGYITARPGLLWDLSKQKVRMGFVGDFTRYIGGNNDTRDALAGENLPAWSRGLSFRIKYIF
jgi:hypothetical protein